jgi:hypothetical protein
MSIAVCDPAAFYSLRSLVAGPLTDFCELTEVERFVRTVVLHDEISMELEPFSYDPDSDHEVPEEEWRDGMRNVAVAVGPVLTGYDFFTSRRSGEKPEIPEITLAPALIAEARKFANAEEGNVYYKAHIGYLQRVVNILQNGGSALLAGKFGSAAIGASTRFPAELFQNLDQGWQQFAKEADAGELGFMVPPVLSIVLSRCARRDAIPIVIKDLRDEWATARHKVWGQVNRLKDVHTIEETIEIRRELEEASRLLSPTQHEIDTRPVRVLWDLVAGGLAGAAIAQISGGHSGVGAAVGAFGKASGSVTSYIYELGPALFGRGAFDFARRVRQETMRVEPGALARLLTDTEKRKLGL